MIYWIISNSTKNQSWKGEMNRTDYCYVLTTIRNYNSCTDVRHYQELSNCQLSASYFWECFFFAICFYITFFSLLDFMEWRAATISLHDRTAMLFLSPIKRESFQTVGLPFCSSQPSRNRAVKVLTRKDLGFIDPEQSSRTEQTFHTDHISFEQLFVTGQRLLLSQTGMKLCRTTGVSLISCSLELL